MARKCVALALKVWKLRLVPKLSYSVKVHLPVPRWNCKDFFRAVKIWIQKRLEKSIRSKKNGLLKFYIWGKSWISVFKASLPDIRNPKNLMWPKATLHILILERKGEGDQFISRKWLPGVFPTAVHISISTIQQCQAQKPQLPCFFSGIWSR